MPPHIHYAEPFFGGGAVLFNHDGEGRSELINDINGALTNFWRVLQDPAAFAEFHRTMEAMPLSRIEREDAGVTLDPDIPPSVNVTQAVHFFVRCRQSLAGRMKNFTSPTRTRLRRGMNGNVSEWLGAVDGLPAVHARLRRVFIEHMDAIRLIPREDTPDTLFYCDPPYLHETRSTPDVYACEMTRDQHIALLDVLMACKGKVMLSGYASELYDDRLRGWRRHTFELPNNAAGGATKQRKIECLWCNF